MKQINLWLNMVSRLVVLAVILSTLFLFTNLTTEFFDTPKFLVLVISTCALLILTTLKFTLSGKVTLIRTPLDLPLLLLLVVASVSTILSPSTFVSLLGNGTAVYTSLVAIVVYVVFYLTLVNNLKSFSEIRQINLLLLCSGVVLSVISLLYYFGIKFLPFTWTANSNFTTLGSTFSLSSILALLIPLLVIEILAAPAAKRGQDLWINDETWKSLGAKGISSKIVNAFILGLFGVTIVLTGTLASWVATIVGLIIIIWITRPDYKKPATLFLVIPVVLTVLVAILSFVPPIGGTQNPFYSIARSFPREIQLDLPTSWKISVSSFRDNPFWGSGPSTYAFDFTNYKPIEFNQTKYWNLRFDSAFNEYLGVLATLGGVALLALVSLTALFISSAYKFINLSRKTLNESQSRLGVGLAVSGITLFVILALHSATLVVWVIGLIILASFMAVNGLTSTKEGPHWNSLPGRDKIFLAVKSTMTDTQSETIKIDALPSVLLTASIALVLFTMFFGGKLALADYHHRLALNGIATNQGLVAYNELVAAEKLNPYSDLYRVDVAQTNFALANAIALAKAPTEASPGGSFTDADRQNIQTLLQQAITEGRTAVTLSPRNANNWEILGALYRQISGVAQNALLFALDSYGRAIQNDPLNPLLRLNVGGTYYAIKNYDLAIRFFTDAINLKPDFANGFYNLSVALRDKGDLNTAITAAERVVALVDKNSSDFKIATEYLESLKSQLPTPTESTDLTTPTSQDSGALQQESLPKILDLPKPDQIASPAAIKRPNSTPEPEPTAAP